MTMPSDAEPHRFTGWHMLAVVLSFFGVIIGVNVWLTVVALRSWTGEVVSDDYAAGQAFEANRVAHEAQVAAGWVASFAYDAGVARLTITDGTGRPVDLGTVTLSLRRPIGEKDDQLLLLLRSPDQASYEARLALPGGTWDAIVTAPQTAMGPFELDHRFTTRSSP